MQIGDFGLARDLGEKDLYQSRGGKIPIKWTAPEVSLPYIVYYLLLLSMYIYTVCTNSFIGTSISTVY